MGSITENIHPNLAQVALDKVEGFVFERFAQDFLSVLEGRNFVPVGGVKDGGADGLYDCGDNRTYYQFTRQENHRDKIRRTVARLREFGRDIKTVYSLTSRLIPHIDKEEDLLTEELGVIIKIRDKKYIVSHMNDSTLINRSLILKRDHIVTCYRHIKIKHVTSSHDYAGPNSVTH